MIKNVLTSLINRADRFFDLRDFMRSGKQTCGQPLSGDRAIEWSYVVANLPQETSHVLDVGCVDSVLSGIAARVGHKVTSVDQRDIEYEMRGVSFIQNDIMELNLDVNLAFDTIINCSFIEHVGLAGRYGSGETPDGDLLAMSKLSLLLAPHGKMILTIPVGVDAVFSPFHRIYGSIRLPRLLEKYKVMHQEFWTKDKTMKWQECPKDIALATQGSSDFYALGLFVLEKL